jgi:ABC-type phosphate/phosphonate transport system substrate-binding protein
MSALGDAIGSSASLANLGMYDVDPAANDAFWAALRQRLTRAGLRDVPARLVRDIPLPRVWAHPQLLFSQICGAPYAAHYSDPLTVIGTPHYTAPGCEGPYHRSFVIVNRASPARHVEDLRGARVAVNDLGSNTGFNLLGDWLGEATGGEPLFGNLRISGAHSESLRLVATGAADVAAIDCVTHAGLARHRPALVAATRIFARTALTPAPPWVVARALASDVLEVLRHALTAVCSSPELGALRARLFLDGFSELPACVHQPTLASAERARAVLLRDRRQSAKIFATSRP